LELSVGHAFDQGEEWPFPQWYQAPTKSLVEQCPLFTKISLAGFTIGQEVMEYFGKFREETGGSVDIDECNISKVDLSLDRLDLLMKLGIGEPTWKDFCK
jgi:hypothetical protein